MVSDTLLISVVGIVTAGMVGMTGLVATLLRASISDVGSSLVSRIDRLETKVDVIQGAVVDIGARLTRLETDLGGK